MAQTKFVLSKALQKGLRPIVVMNKVDRDGVTADGCAEVESKLFDLFASMGADDEQLDFATVYASAREGAPVSTSRTRAARRAPRAAATCRLSSMSSSSASLPHPDLPRSRSGCWCR